jgi:23S rRNA pseudouridine1911/1915/1917 synthase
MKHSTSVDATQDGKRIDLFVGHWLTLSRNQQKSLFENEAVRVNGRKVKKGITVKTGDAVEVELVAQNVDVVAEGSLDVLFEDEHLVFVNKPAGMPVQPLDNNESGTIANALLLRFPEMKTVGDDVREAGLCHRLDIETSGVLLAARNREAWVKMREAFGENRGIEKHYLALVTGPLSDEGTIEIPLAHRGDHVRPIFGDEKSREAITEYKVLKRSGRYSLVDVTLITGVLHQVRAHLAAVGAPIVQDTLYDGEAYEGLTRFFLHAHSLTVKHPVTGEPLRVEAPLPQALQEIVSALF